MRDVIQYESKFRKRREIKMPTPLLELRNIGKIYVSEGNVAVGIRGVNLSFDRGEFVAVTGKSGSGKSTIAKLIAGFWDVSSGSITMGSQELKKIPLTELYEQIAYVSQDNYLFDLSVIIFLQWTIFHL